MPRVSCVVFAARQLTPGQVAGCRVLDVGACDYNGSIRGLIEAWGCGEYIGIDLAPGPGVDRVMDANDLVEVFGEGAFDIVLALEMMEHTPDWRRSLSNLKRACRAGGMIIATAPARGYMYHGYPHDYWRYEPDDWRELFADCEIVAVEYDASGPGSFVAARKGDGFVERDLSEHELFSVVVGRRVRGVGPGDYRTAYFRRLRLKLWLKETHERALRMLGRLVTRVLRLR